MFGRLAGGYLGVNNKLSVKKEDLPVKEEGFLAAMGCVHGDGQRCCHLAFFGCCPCIYALWRKAIREKYGIPGNILADCCVSCFCGCLMPLAIMQDARLIKSKH